MYDKMTMSGVARGYKQSGKRLLPRDAGECQVPGRNQRERNRYVAAELRHNREVEEHFLGGMSRVESRALATRAAISARRAAPVQALFDEVIEAGDWDWARKVSTLLGNAQRRYFNALADMYHAAMAEAADDLMGG